MFEQHTLAVIFASLMALACLLYAILDGYDLGVGILLQPKQSDDADIMISSIGPFWDANETWLVLAVGLLLIAFPSAHSMVLKALYLPSCIMLIGLILRGVAFDFRAKAGDQHKLTWDRMFKLGSLVASLSQGYMLGRYVGGFSTDLSAYLFAIASAIGVTSAYALIGATWIVMKCEGALQQRAIQTSKRLLLITLFGTVLVSVTNLVVNPGVYDKWFQFPYGALLLPLPVICLALFVLCYSVLVKLAKAPTIGSRLPFFIVVFIFTLSFFGLAFSFFPFIVPEQLTIWQAVASAESLNFLLWGALVVIPTIILYTIFVYRVFWGKTTELTYY